ncbi:hypothetical protein Z042_08635 [Chania multitudinisentens RB-25]|uniref:Uncharacterized protein n=1 Tax=Chania multitudinisentens RB-25 TaxID=1441930 RepID=W0LL38_9GAMM|nr:hypothetical protein [Chania multitudinisentens]AHG22720.1 hypothetical protein Z042_08635 [Chania multitudinisentens RB-25]
MSSRLAKQKSNIITVLLLILNCVAFFVVWNLIYPASPVLKTNFDLKAQLGFYDLISSQYEVYNLDLESTQGTIITTVINPDQPEFLFKGKLTRINMGDSKLGFYLTPIYYRTPKQNLIMDGFLNQLTYGRFSAKLLSNNANRLVLGPNGIIFIT